MNTALDLHTGHDPNDDTQLLHLDHPKTGRLGRLMPRRRYRGKHRPNRVRAASVAAITIGASLMLLSAVAGIGLHVADAMNGGVGR